MGVDSDEFPLISCILEQNAFEVFFYVDVKSILRSESRHGAYKLLLFLHQSQYLGRVLIAALSPLKVVVCSFLHGHRVVPLLAFSNQLCAILSQVCAESIPTYDSSKRNGNQNYKITATLYRAKIRTVQVV